MPNLDSINDIISKSKRKPKLATKLHSELTSAIGFVVGNANLGSSLYGGVSLLSNQISEMVIFIHYFLGHSVREGFGSGIDPCVSFYCARPIEVRTS